MYSCTVYTYMHTYIYIQTCWKELLALHYVDAHKSLGDTNDKPCLLLKQKDSQAEHTHTHTHTTTHSQANTPQRRHMYVCVV